MLPPPSRRAHTRRWTATQGVPDSAGHLGYIRMSPSTATNIVAVHVTNPDDGLEFLLNQTLVTLKNIRQDSVVGSTVVNLHIVLRRRIFPHRLKRRYLHLPRSWFAAASAL